MRKYYALEHIPEEKVALFRQRLDYYRNLYKPVCEQEESES